MAVVKSDPSSSRLAEQFANPPKAFSPVPIWWWSGDRLERGRLRWQMEQLIAGGVYNAIVVNLAPTGPLYGSDPDQPAFQSEEWWDLFLDVCEDARELGFRIWFYDQIGFSGANLQGVLVREEPAFAGQSLESITTEGEGPLELTCPSEGIPLAAAYIPLDGEGRPAGEPVTIPLDGRSARTDQPERKRLRLMYAIRRGFDYFNPAACARLLDIVHGAFERRAGRYFGDVIVGSFQDELPTMPTWGTGFAEGFQRLYGYDLREKLAYLWEGEGEAAQRARVDYHQARARLSETAFFKPFFDWHEERGLVCGFDQQGPARSGHPIGGVQLYANYLLTHRWYAIPGSDHHGGAKIHSSLAHQYGRPRVWIEAFHSSGWGGTLEETFDWLLPWLGAGATLYDPHAVYYSTRGGWWEWAPPSTCWRQPYWRHYANFANAVSRLCFLLSQGDHICDTAVLYPTTTVQSGLTLEHPLEAAQTAHAVYESLTGSMMWMSAAPGVLDQDRRDFDVLDDETIRLASVADGKIVVQDEHYSTFILPAAAVLQSETAAQLTRFVENGGKLIAVGRLPERVVGEGAGSVDALRRLFEDGKAVLVEQPEGLPAALQDLPRRVDAPVPALHRRVDGQDVVYVPAAYPYASYTPDSKGTWWIKPEYRFDPGRYASSIRVTVRGISGTPELWDPLTGQRRTLISTPVEGGAEIEVPFDGGPAALVVWTANSGPQAGSGLPASSGLPAGEATQGEAGKKNSAAVLHEFTGPWEFTLEPTLDNRYGDLDKPNYPGSPPLQTWQFEHRSQAAGEDGESAGWHNQAPSGPGWETVHATFGQYGWWTGPCPAGELPAPARQHNGRQPEGQAAGNWQPAVYSLQRGIQKDPLHMISLGPKGHVFEEFLRLGQPRPGESVQFRTTVWMPEAQTVHLAVGAPARKTVWINGQPAGQDTPGYLWVAPVHLSQGSNLLEFRLEVDEDDNQGKDWFGQPMDLRAYWALVRDPAAFRRPERMAAPGAPRKDSQLQFCLEFEVPFTPSEMVLQVSADAPARVVVNDVEAGRQGGFDPYHSLARVQPYPVHSVRQGHNQIILEVQDIGQQAAVLADGLIPSADGQTLAIISGGHWHVSRDGGEPQPVQLVRRQWQDPAWSHLWRRPHPLPGAMWIEDQPAGDTVLPVVPDAAGHGDAAVEWFRWTVPPGAVRMEIPAAGKLRLWVDGQGVTVEPGAGGGAAANLPAGAGASRAAVLRVEPNRGRTGGGVFFGPVTYTTGKGQIQTGEWGEQGLSAYSGGVRYASSFTLQGTPSGRVVLDLGRVRGTAEVWLNGQNVGTRVLSPYRFDLTGAVKAGENRVEILVLNTLGPYIEAVSPTHFVHAGQTVSGMLGPVRIYGEQ